MLHFEFWNELQRKWSDSKHCCPSVLSFANTPQTFDNTALYACSPLQAFCMWVGVCRCFWHRLMLLEKTFYSWGLFWGPNPSPNDSDCFEFLGWTSSHSRIQGVYFFLIIMLLDTDIYLLGSLTLFPAVLYTVWNLFLCVSVGVAWRLFFNPVLQCLTVILTREPLSCKNAPSGGRKFNLPSVTC